MSLNLPIRKLTILAPNSDAKSVGGMRLPYRRTRLTFIALSTLVIVTAGCGRDPASSTPASPTLSAVSAPQAPSGQAEVTIYKCPMHPDVTSDKPGKCSVCGMNLVQVSP